MDSDFTILETELKSRGYSCTHARKRVFGALLGKEPMMMSELLSIVEDTNRASVYRTVKLFESLGIINRIPLGWKYKLELSDMFSQHHHHILCKKCGTIKDLAHSQEIEKLIDAISLEQSYTPISHQLEIIGICQNCRD